RQWRWKVVVMVSSENEKPASRAGHCGLMNGDGARLRTAAEDLQLDGDAREQRQHHAGGDHADGGLHGGAAHQADAVHQGAQVADIERGLVAVETDIGQRALRTFLGGARQDRLELGVRHAHEALGSGWCHRDPPSAAQPILQPQKDVWSAAKYPSATRKYPCSSTVSPAVSGTM